MQAQNDPPVHRGAVFQWFSSWLEIHYTALDMIETPELPEAVHLDVRHAVVLLPVDLHWLRALPSLLLQQPLQLPELPVPRPLRPGDSAPLLRTGATPPQLSESLLHPFSIKNACRVFLVGLVSVSRILLPSILDGGVSPAMSRKVGARSMLRTGWSLKLWALTPGPRTKKGTWVSKSYGKAFPFRSPNCPR